MRLGVKVWHQHLDTLARDLFLAVVAEDLDGAHVALGDNTQTVLLPRDVDARGTILCIITDV